MTKIQLSFPPRFTFYVRSLLFFRFKEISIELFLDILSYSFHTSYYKQRLWRENLATSQTLSHRTTSGKPLLASKTFPRYLFTLNVFLLRGNSNTRNVFFRVANKIETQLLKTRMEIIRLSQVNDSVCFYLLWTRPLISTSISLPLSKPFSWNISL